jgi:hypothetical protein
LTWSLLLTKIGVWCLGLSSDSVSRMTIIQVINDNFDQCDQLYLSFFMFLLKWYETSHTMTTKRKRAPIASHASCFSQYFFLILVILSQHCF